MAWLGAARQLPAIVVAISLGVWLPLLPVPATVLAMASAPETTGSFAPLREPVFRRIWSASVLSNFGHLILGVAAAWEMTRLSNSPAMVALVQTAMMLPLMLISLPAGAVADMFDRRKVAMAGLAFSVACSAVLTALSFAGLAGPWVLLAFCALIGAGVALYSPAWQSSVGEQVPPAQLPAAIALGTISYNVARSVGPAIGGLIVLAGGATAAFGLNMLCYIPLLIAFFLWQRRHSPSRLPPERIDRAIMAGMRYARHSGPIRTVLIRTFLFGLASATASALAPLIAKDLLGGDSSVFGILLGASGLGAVTGAMFTARVRDALGEENAVRLLTIISGLALIGVGFSRTLPLTCLALFITGAVNILTIALHNVSVQLAAPRWVTARALSLFSAAMTGGIAFGAWAWGMAALEWGVANAIIASGGAVLLLPIIALGLPLPVQQSSGVGSAPIGNEVDVGLDLTMRSGPINIEIDYRVDPAKARDFYAVMLKVQKVRQRNGGFDWSIARDIADPDHWTERYHCPTWGDYLRMRDRYTEDDVQAQVDASNLCLAGSERAVTRRLERPFGSVRWQAESPDLQQEVTNYVGP
jgi:MFS family permease